MEHHPAKLCTDLACLAATIVTAAGWLPAFFTAAASLAAALYYGIAVYDRLKKGKFHGQPDPAGGYKRRSTD